MTQMMHATGKSHGIARRCVCGMQCSNVRNVHSTGSDELSLILPNNVLAFHKRHDRCPALSESEENQSIPLTLIGIELRWISASASGLFKYEGVVRCHLNSSYVIFNFLGL